MLRPRVSTMNDAPATSFVRWRILVRAAWAGVVLVTCCLFAAGVPDILPQLRTPCAGSGCARWQLTPDMAAKLPAHHLSIEAFAAYSLTLDALFVLGFCTISMVIMLRGAGEPMAVLASFMLATFGPSFSNTIVAASEHSSLAWWPRTVLACAGWAALFTFFSRFPDGAFVPRWTCWLAAAWMTFVILAFFAPAGWVIRQGGDRARSGPLFGVGVLLFFASVVTLQIYRFRRVSTPVQRQQTKWVVYGFFLAFGGLALNILVLGGLAANDALIADLVLLLWFYAVLLLLPVSIGIAVLRYRLWDIDPLINRTLVYSGLTAGVVLGYILVVGYLGTLFRTGGNLFVSLVATGVVAMLFAPLRERLQHAVNRLMYGERDRPYDVLARLGRRLEGSLAPDDVLPLVVEDIAAALRLPHVGLWLRDGEQLRLSAAHGRSADLDPVHDPDAVRRLRESPDGIAPAALGSASAFASVLGASAVTLIVPLLHHGALVGALCLAPRAAGEAFSRADRRLLRDLAAQSSAAVDAVQLTATLRASLDQLQRSRERLVAAREDERRRLQRDLHDGLGPVLASIRLRLEACLDMAAGEPGTPLVGQLRQIHALVGQATADIRRLVYDLRPPVLDQLGVVPAIQEHCDRFGRETGIDVRFAADPGLTLPAAVEVALLRVAQEALLNVQKHAGANRVEVSLRQCGATLRLTVRDDGVGLRGNGQGGTGLGAMRERAELLGGSLRIGAGAVGGTAVTLHLPLAEGAR